MDMLSSHPHEAMLPYVPRPPPSLLVDRRAYKTGAEVAPNCPRCDSPNTKFCYYNNYSLTQPRYFCKGCRRYWTKGGSLRNVPVGGGCRKNRRGKSSSSSSMRSSSASDSSFSGAGRDAGPFGSHRFGSATGSLRPDMVLEGMVGNNPADPGHDMRTAADASTIDLAMLYSKFLNNQQPGNNNAVTPESAGGHVMDDGFDTFSGSSDVLRPGVLAAPGGHFDLSPQDGFGEWSGPLSSAGAAGNPASATSTTTSAMLCTDASVQAALGELNFVMDQSCFDALGLPMPAEDGGASSVGNDLSSWCSIVPSLSTWEEPKYDSLDSFPDDALSLHDHGILAADHDWSADCQGLEALYMP
ncbi:uncharacterized protein LOC100821289 [Brachypodium distachyon]|uniref:Dof zinc finger protein n=1 Tax=Brachypodium distachyon TaxID=15368 RepID=I1HTQ3_BRADI|nr:uncharacterized protein LOC100821289 [Brachypodium distachyon]PNT73247.1 hypothetical protein BRADI_2g55980v3 [Brachypodium distachyon]|eukprot:XP_003564686.2 uncharacterized protein LOC100821289 [Brachypodium distachyon]